MRSSNSLFVNSIGIGLTGRIASAVQPGDHATTFGGGPLVASVALAVLRTVADPAFLADVRRKGDWLAARLRRVWSYRDLLRGLVAKELKVRYKNSFLGLAWSMVV